MDADGPKITDTFYKNLFKECGSTTTDAIGPNTTQAAQALFMSPICVQKKHILSVGFLLFIWGGETTQSCQATRNISIPVHCNIYVPFQVTGAALSLQFSFPGFCTKLTQEAQRRMFHGTNL